MMDWAKKLNLGGLEQEHALPSGLLSAVMQAESSGNPDAQSKAGALGLFQFMPETAKAYGIDPLNPEQAAIGAARMYGDLNKKYKGDIDSMLAAYNWGSGNLAKNGMENAPKETRDYIAKIKASLQPQYADISEAKGQVADAGNIATDASVDDTTDVELPDGTVIEGVPAGITQAELVARLKAGGYDVSGMEPQPEPEKPREQSIDATVRDQALQGAFFGLGDEAQAGLAALWKSGMDGGSVSDNYDKALEIARGNVASQQEQNPGTSLLSQLAGGAAGFGLAAKAAPSITGKLAKYATGKPYKAAAITGAVSGGAYGFGTGEGDAESRAKSALGGLAIGGIAGPVATGVGRNVIEPLMGKTGVSKLAALAEKQPTNVPAIPVAPSVPAVARKPGEMFSKTAGQRSQNVEAQRLENDALAGLKGAENQAAVQTAQKIQNQQFDDYVRSLSGGLDEGADINSIVDGLGQNLRTRYSAAKTATQDAYKATKGNAVKIGVKDVQEGLFDGLAQIRKEGAFDINTMPAAKGVMKALANVSGKGKLKNVTTAKLDALENIRKMATNAANDAKGSSEGVFMKQFVNHYDKTMEDIASRAAVQGDKQAISAFRDAIKARRMQGQLFESNKLVKSIASGEMSVDDTVKNLIGTGAIKGKKGMAQNLDAILKASGDDAPNVQADLKQAFVRNIYDRIKSGKLADSEIDRLSPAKLKTELESLFVNQSDFAKKLFGNDAVKGAQQAIKELELISTTQPSVRNPSGSGELIGRFLSPLLNAPGVRVATGAVKVANDAGKSIKTSKQLDKALEEFESAINKPQKSNFWPTFGATAGSAAGNIEQIDQPKKGPLKLTIRPEDK